MSGVVLRSLVGLRCAWCRPVLYPLSACSRSCTSLSPGPAVQAAPAATAAVQSPPTAQATTTASPSEWRAPTTPIRQSMFAGVHLDTHQMIKELQAAGLTPAQSEAVVSTMGVVTKATLDRIASSDVSTKDMEVLELKLRRIVELLQKDLVLLEKSSIASLNNENQYLKLQVQKFKDGFKDEVQKIESHLTLDLNLEKSRIREEFTSLDQRIKDTNNRIGTEVAGLRTQIESQKSEWLKYFGGIIFSMVTVILSVVLGLWRLIK
ncbi:hypothetical protein EMCRGX_G031614 [Ephydatia muelleri]